MMPIFNIGILASAGGSDPRLMSIIQNLGLAANLKLCLDAGDSASYPGSGQTWADRSGQAVDFYRGLGSGSESTDPTFNGVAGRLSSSEYWSFDGVDDRFRIASGANPAWLETFHKDGATFTSMFAFLPTTANTEKLFWDSGADQIGIALRQAAGSIQTRVDNSSPALLHTSSGTLNNGAWNIFGVSISENAGASGGIDFINGSSATFNPAYSSPSSSSSTTAIVMGGQSGPGAHPIAATSRLGWAAVWDIALTAAQMQVIFEQTRGRFGI
jgi:hypothetical protein